MSNNPVAVTAAFARAAATSAMSTAYDGRQLSLSRLDKHVDAGLAWLERAQDRSPDGGVSYGYSLRGGWLPPYRETSGYICTTFFRAANARQRPELARRAVRVAEWLITVQNRDGSFANPKYGDEGLVFDTGQDLFGLVAAFQHTADDRFLASAERAGAWLVDAVDGDGVWRRHEYRGVEHTYNSRTAWALLRLDEVLPDERWQRTARANLHRAVAAQRGNGFFDRNAFLPGKDPYTHNISYAICGLQESGWILRDADLVAAARRCSDAALTHMRSDGFVPGQISVDGTRVARYSCLTGQCQLSIVWAEQYLRTGDPRYLGASQRALAYALRHHDVQTKNPNIRGGLAGSAPIWGRYAPMSYPNWATKFLVDACLLQSRITASPSGMATSCPP